MKIRYTGTAGVRIVEPYRWDASNGYVQDVTDPAILENLLTYPKPEFEEVEIETPCTDALPGRLYRSTEEIIPEAGQPPPVKKPRKERKSYGIR
jgi:hypothetical protein